MLQLLNHILSINYLPTTFYISCGGCEFQAQKLRNYFLLLLSKLHHHHLHASIFHCIQYYCVAFKELYGFHWISGSFFIQLIFSFLPKIWIKYIAKSVVSSVQYPICINNLKRFKEIQYCKLQLIRIGIKWWTIEINCHGFNYRLQVNFCFDFNGHPFRINK